MSKYDGLWKWIAENGQDQFKLTYAQIEELESMNRNRQNCSHWTNKAKKCREKVIFMR